MLWKKKRALIILVKTFINWSCKDFVGLKEIELLQYTIKKVRAD